MEPLRLDPADPLASVLRWLAALARALGIDPACAGRPPLTNGAATVVRRWLRDWRRQLEALVRAEALRLALSLRPGVASRAARATAASSAPSFGVAGCGRLSLASGRAVSGVSRSAPGPDARPKPRPARFALLGPAAEAALQRRTRALSAALRDPGAAIRRLAARLAKRLARACGTEAAHRRHSPPVIGLALRAFDLAPEPRPPDRSALRRSAARPTVSVAAAPVSA
jgi:hypothetical protein